MPGHHNGLCAAGIERKPALFGGRVSVESFRA